MLIRAAGGLLAMTMLVGTGTLAGTASAWAKPSAVVSIAPVHALLASVMEGVAQPRLLVSGGASPHTYQLRPSEAQALNDADLVVWVGEGLETFLVKPIEALGSSARSVELSEDVDLVLLANREGGAWESDGHGHGHDGKHSHDRTQGHDHGGKHGHDHGASHDHAGEDMHVWLDPENARLIVRHLAGVLTEIDPANAAAYAANADATIGRIDALDAELDAALAPVRAVPYIVFHDGFQYLERRYGLNAVGSVTISPEQAPGVRRLREIRKKMSDSGARCVFSEPQFPSSLVATVTEGTPVRTAELDPLGATLDPGPGLYGALMRKLASNLKDCLGGPL